MGAILYKTKLWFVWLSKRVVFTKCKYHTTLRLQRSSKG